jgi:hypothetical protein
MRSDSTRINGFGRQRRADHRAIPERTSATAETVTVTQSDMWLSVATRRLLDPSAACRPGLLLLPATSDARIGSNCSACATQIRDSAITWHGERVGGNGTSAQAPCAGRLAWLDRALCCESLLVLGPQRPGSSVLSMADRATVLSSTTSVPSSRTGRWVDARLNEVICSPATVPIHTVRGTMAFW